MASTAPTTSRADSSSAPVRGTTGVIRRNFGAARAGIVKAGAAKAGNVNDGVMKDGAVKAGVMMDGTVAMLIKAQSMDAVALAEVTSAMVGFMAASPEAAVSELEVVRAVEVDSTVADIAKGLQA